MGVTGGGAPGGGDPFGGMRPPGSTDGVFGKAGRRMVMLGLVVLACAGGYLIFRGLDLPDFSGSNTTGASPADFAAGSESVPGGKTLLKTENFVRALGAFSGEVGSDPKVTKVQVTPNNVDFHLREGENVEGFGYTAADQKLHPIQVRVVGSGSIEGLDFPLTRVQPEAIDRLVEGASRKSGLKNFKVTVMTLERGPTHGPLRWTIVGEGGGRSGVVLTARPDGSRIKGPEFGPSPSAPAPEVRVPDPGQLPEGVPPQARRLIECVQSAAGDVQRLQECQKRFSP